MLTTKSAASKVQISSAVQSESSWWNHSSHNSSVNGTCSCVGCWSDASESDCNFVLFTRNVVQAGCLSGGSLSQSHTHSKKVLHRANLFLVLSTRWAPQECHKISVTFVRVTLQPCQCLVLPIVVALIFLKRWNSNSMLGLLCWLWVTTRAACASTRLAARFRPVIVSDWMAAWSVTWYIRPDFVRWPTVIFVSALIWSTCMNIYVQYVYICRCAYTCTCTW